MVLEDKNERQQVCEIFKEYPDAAVDMSGSRYILLLLFAEAVHHQLPVFYFDAEEFSFETYRSVLGNDQEKLQENFKSI